MSPGNGAAGTLTVSCSVFYLRNGSTNAFEFGEGEANRDLIAVTGDLNLGSTWTLRLADLGTKDRFKVTDRIDLITYTGSLTDAGSGIGSGDGAVSSVTLDCSALDDGPGEWDYSSAEVRYDVDNGRIYLTGVQGGAPSGGTVIVIR